MEILLVKPRGFCAGVDRAIEIVKLALETFGPPVYVRHEIVHNRHVVEGLRSLGARFVDDLAHVPPGSVVIFSAHGVSPAVRVEARIRGLRTIDATCPLVTKVHLEAIRYAREGYGIVLIGHPGHVEVEGTMGEVPGGIWLVSSPAEVDHLDLPDRGKVAYLTQTTLSVDDTQMVVDALKRRFPGIRGPRKDDICYATTNRQLAVKAISEEADVILVVGAPESSNANRLVEVAEARGVRSYLVESADDIEPKWIKGARRVGLTAGASAPERLVREVVDRLLLLGGTRVREIELMKEDITFALPPELKEAMEARADHPE
ncbi:MAG: 4-hydroxy-3-methylbut-2-enyl diphosphate reductase [Deltaproteobacteria bacterium RBG_13_65_10]|nr:MAG: 4-hydroxy-3-methylbut-2-enyl diphosphate reductase [Deltaproteobacteria bacterium RBG_13_65_10]